MTATQASNVKSLIILMLLSVGCAVAIAVYSVRTFGPSGVYEVENTLITPYLLENMSYDDFDTKTGAQTRFVYDELLYSYWHKNSQKNLTVPIDLQLYRHFYDIVRSDSSIPDGGENLNGLFHDADNLSIKVKTVSDDPLSKETKIFQSVQFAREGNFYRIQLREELQPDGEWAYFNHLGITEKIRKLFEKQ